MIRKNGIVDVVLNIIDGLRGVPSHQLLFDALDRAGVLPLQEVNQQVIARSETFQIALSNAVLLCTREATNSREVVDTLVKADRK